MSNSRRGVWLVIILILLAVFVSAGGLMLIALMGGSPPGVPSNATLYVPLRPPYPEVMPSDVFSAFAETPTLRETVRLIDDASIDSRVDGLVVTIQATGSLWGQLQELRGALARFKASGKPVTAFLEFGGPGEYYVASVADEIVFLPAGSLDVAGLASYEVFFRGLLDKVGVYPDMLQIGDFKTAANTFTEQSMTPAHREMAESMNRDQFDALVEAVAAGRNMPADEARAALTGGPYTADQAMAAGLVDRLGYEDELDDEAPIRGTRKLQADDYREATEYRRPGRSGASAGRVAIVYAAGTIASGRSDGAAGAVVGSESFAEWMRTVRVDPLVRAVVLRIDSPGGSAIASEVMWREVMLTREVKPVIVSMGDVAASGGYYIAAPATAIVAQPGTLTGSIGVVTGKFVLDGALDAIGIGVEAVSEGERAQIYSPFREFSPAERERVAAQMRETYDLFVRRVADGRDRSADEIDAVGQGRVWTGRQALEQGLVDQLGGLDEALRLAREHAKLDPERPLDLVVYPRKRSIYEVLANPLGSAAELRQAQLFTRPELRALDTATSWFRLFRRGEPLALMPSLFVGGS